LVVTEYYLLVQDHSVAVKEAEFFKSQGGLTDTWGKAWEGPWTGDSLYAARREGIRRRRERYPHSHPTLGEYGSMEDAWPEAKGK
jgi:hypothetical protein